MDDYEMIAKAFSSVKSAKLQTMFDVEGNPILKVKIANVTLTFYFDVDEFKDEAKFSRLLIVEEAKP